jgi:hypothetical protein
MRMKINANLPCLTALLAAALLLSGCASQQYMGVSLKPGGSFQAMAVKAQSGDKQAQYELAIRLEDSTEPNGLKNAIKLYQIAATPRGGSQLMFTPGPSGVTTSVVSSGPKIEAHVLAKERLAVLQNFHYERARDIRLTNARLGQIVTDRFSEISSARYSAKSSGNRRFYPGGDDECPYSSWDPLEYMMGEYVGGAILALPFACISPARVNELVKLADKGNPSAQLALATLVLEIKDPNFDYAIQVVRHLSNKGFGPASIVYGNYLLSLGKRSAAISRYSLAGRQGIVNFDIYRDPVIQEDVRRAIRAHIANSEKEK